MSPYISAGFISPEQQEMKDLLLLVLLKLRHIEFMFRSSL